ncbi:DUF4184 family protein [Streptomyces europaeiscabiei]|uniref:DUF4184 family protein n=1 Tax=Streptomyces europaeiscabiei TaxID=146819 RepID=UPI0029B6607A|nr:DUF4184 family protein [Streptomyces europaeiscabiei]MDX2530210.1 DUF4184 family protein [Streptomyces europaeiscabiei]MDX3861213.1 DUF4184 family protein [Streptomyces europaeiscabiei]MDX3868636.1 DUF4184 family protein [Streptomyces europaeiscabiei]
MPFTLSHPAAVLPLMRRPFVPASLVAGAVAPDVPYFLDVLGVSETSPQDWYGPLLNATETHSLGVGLVVNLPLAIGLVAAYRMLRAPITALLPSDLRLPEPERTTGLSAKVRYTMWLLVSALIGIASHLAWDSFTHGDGFLVTHVQPLRASALGGLSVARLLQYASTAFGLAAVGWHLWRRRDRLRTHGGTDTVARLGPVMRWSVVTLLVAAPVLGGAVNARDDFNAYRYVTEVDHSQPTTVARGDGAMETTYPSRMVQAPWGTLAEGVLTGAAKRAGASFAVALLLYSATWQIGAISRRPATASSPAPSPQPTQDDGARQTVSAP